VDKSRYSIVITINNKDMAKTAVKSKTTKKVSTAKGKGKVVKKTATKKAVAKKPAVKRAPKMVDPNKYGRFTILDAFTEKYPEMVIIDKAPAAYSKLVGKKYVSRERFITFIESEKAEVAIDKGAKSVLKEMDAAGIIPLDVESI
jgi:hypothetical protein